MEFPAELTRARLIKRYKRFLADVELPSGEVVVAHCANSGSMMGVAEPDSTVWLSPNQNPKAKLDWRWEMIEVNDGLVGINTSRPNAIVEEAIQQGRVPELNGYTNLRREVKYGQNSRIDILLEGPGLCYVEVKNVTLADGELAMFPDAVTARGTKHLKELSDMVSQGHRAVMLYLVQRMDCVEMRPAEHIDPTYASALIDAVKDGVEALCYTCNLTLDEVRLDHALPIRL